MRTINTRVLAAVLLLAACDDAKTPAPAAVAADAPSPAPATKPAPAVAPTKKPETAAAAPAAPPAAAPAPVPTPTPVAAEFDPFKEKFGELSFGLAVDRVQELFPAIESKGKRRADLVDDGQLAGYDQQWIDKTSGVTLTLTSETKTSAQTVSSISIESPSTLRTSSGIGIGDTVEAVRKAYPEIFDGESDAELVTLEGWLTLTIKDGKVAKLAFSEPYMGG
jgi:hypothetical protein